MKNFVEKVKIFNNLINPKSLVLYPEFYVSEARPIFIGGCGRSGTTLLRVLIRYLGSDPKFKITIFFKLPFFWKKHVFQGEHYWETGKKNYQISKIKNDIQSVGLKIEKVKIYHDDPAHLFILLKK